MMKLVSLLCLILGTACVTDSNDVPIEPNAPDLEPLDPPSAEAELDPIAPNGPFDERPGILPERRPGAGQVNATEPEILECTLSTDCAADEICDAGTCQPTRACSTAANCEPGESCVGHVCVL
jgi:hypothetical protein